MQDEIPLACSLTQAEYGMRKDEIQKMFTSSQQLRELADGYAFQFPGDHTWLDKLTHFIAEERACCPFFAFELHFEPAQGPIWMSIRGQEGVKEMLKDQFLV
ncbi:MAG: hypothetical protein NVS2B12_30750 [Ktedonobacteraceae bacterium]